VKVELKMFGAFRAFEPAPHIELELPDDACVADLRLKVREHGERHWPGFKAGLLDATAFASETRVLRDTDALPADGRMAVLPPVSGG
jgi:molybdopterin synthase sulfur carrier subunit